MIGFWGGGGSKNPGAKKKKKANFLKNRKILVDANIFGRNVREGGSKF